MYRTAKGRGRSGGHTRAYTSLSQRRRLFVCIIKKCSDRSCWVESLTHPSSILLDMLCREVPTLSAISSHAFTLHSMFPTQRRKPMVPCIFYAYSILLRVNSDFTGTKGLRQSSSSCSLLRTDMRSLSGPKALPFNLLYVIVEEGQLRSAQARTTSIRYPYPSRTRLCVRRIEQGPVQRPERIARMVTPA